MALAEEIAIISALALCSEPIDYEYGDCKLCDGKTERHTRECPWLNARNYMKKLGQNEATPVDNYGPIAHVSEG